MATASGTGSPPAWVAAVGPGSSASAPGSLVEASVCGLCTGTVPVIRSGCGADSEAGCAAARLLNRGVCEKSAPPQSTCDHRRIWTLIAHRSAERTAEHFIAGESAAYCFRTVPVALPHASRSMRVAMHRRMVRVRVRVRVCACVCGRGVCVCV